MSDIVLGAVQRGEFNKVLEVATTFLNWQNPYWNTFDNPEHLAGWLLTNLHCPYCGVDLLEQHIPAHLAQTDHLLPEKKYPSLRTSMMNAVASCNVCNSMKHEWDPNEADPVYFDGELSYQTRIVLIERVKHKLQSMPRGQFCRPLDMQQVRLAATQAREKLA
jgi:hypothetical protein